MVVMVVVAVCTRRRQEIRRLRRVYLCLVVLKLLAPRLEEALRLRVLTRVNIRSYSQDLLLHARHQPIIVITFLPVS